MNKIKHYKIFLDDVRQPDMCLSYMYTRIGALNPTYNEEWVVVKNFDEFKKAIDDYFPYISHISFDHDLADIYYDPFTQKESFKYQEKTGYDCAKYLINYYEYHNEQLPKYLWVHSMNPVGTKNIQQLLES